MFDDCTVKYHENINSGVVDSIIVTYPTVKDKDGVDSWRKLCVPMVEENSDYQDILEWVADGNTIEAAD